MQFQAVGGFLELENSGGLNEKEWDKALNSGRSGLEMILRERHPNRLWIPFFICGCVPELLKETGQKFSLYHVNAQLEMESLLDLAEGDMILYVNYFGIKDKYCNMLLQHYGDSLILDLTQAFFYQEQITSISFSSARKFLGIPDGAFVTGISEEISTDLPVASSADHAAHLLLRADGKMTEAYHEFQQNEGRFAVEHPLKISKLSCSIARGIDLKRVQTLRKQNFSLMATELAAYNQLNVSVNNVSPISYPLLVKNGKLIRQKLISEKIFIPSYWSDLENLNQNEQCFADNILHLPIDQRYPSDALRPILSRVVDYLKTM